MRLIKTARYRPLPVRHLRIKPRHLHQIAAPRDISANEYHITPPTPRRQKLHAAFSVGFTCAQRNFSLRCDSSPPRAVRCRFQRLRHPTSAHHKPGVMTWNHANTPLSLHRLCDRTRSPLSRHAFPSTQSCDNSPRPPPSSRPMVFAIVNQLAVRVHIAPSNSSPPNIPAPARSESSQKNSTPEATPDADRLRQPPNNAPPPAPPPRTPLCDSNFARYDPTHSTPLSPASASDSQNDSRCRSIQAAARCRRRVG